MATVTFGGSSLYKEPKAVNVGILDLSQNFRDWTGTLKQADGEDKLTLNLSGITKESDLSIFSGAKVNFATVVITGLQFAGTYTMKLNIYTFDYENYNIDGVKAISYQASFEEV